MMMTSHHLFGAFLLFSSFAMTASSTVYEPIESYQPMTPVTDHNAMDLDVEVIHVELGFTAASSFLRAEAFYKQGAYSGAYAELTLNQNGGVTAFIPQGTQVVGENDAGDRVSGTTMEDLDVGVTIMRVRYDTTNVQAEYSSCQVGALPLTGFQRTAGCFKTEGSVDINGKGIYTYIYDVIVDNSNDRTLQKFSSEAETDKLLCYSCPHRTFQKFFDYYEVPDYGDRWILAAFQQAKTRYVRGTADFSGYTGEGRAAAVKTGITCLNVWMQVISRMEETFDFCVEKDYIRAFFAWDQSVAFYTGSTEGQLGTGYMIHAVANELCQDFKTCGEFGSEVIGTAAVTEAIFHEFELGQKGLNETDCEAVRTNKVKIENKMAVPLVQGTLRYAFIRGRLSDGETSQADGASFAASVLPLVHHCKPEDAAIIYENMKVGSNLPDFGQVKRALERNYKCMGISCAEVGGFYDKANGKYYNDASPCTNTEEDGNNFALVQGLFFGLIIPVIVLVGWIIYRRRKNKQEAELYSTETNLVYPSASNAFLR